MYWCVCIILLGILPVFTQFAMQGEAHEASVRRIGGAGAGRAAHLRELSAVQHGRQCLLQGGAQTEAAVKNVLDQPWNQQY